MSSLRKHTNNFITSLTSSISDSDLSFTLDDSIPTSLSGSQYVYLTITDNIYYEIVKISSLSGAPTYTTEREQEGTSARNWPAGTKVSCRLTRDSVDTKQDDLDNLSISTTTLSSDDRIIIQDNDDSGKIKTVLPSAIIGVASPFQFITSKTASNSASLDFTDLPSCNAIMFLFVNIIPATDNVYFRLRTSTNIGGSPSYDTGGTDYYSSYHGAANANTHASSMAQWDSVRLHNNATGNMIGNQSDEGLSGTMYIYNPTSASNAKHIRGMISYTDPAGGEAVYDFSGKRLNTSAVNAIQFSMSSGNIASGIIYAYKIV